LGGRINIMAHASARFQPLDGLAGRRPVASMVAVAALTALVGGMLEELGEWPGGHVLAGWLAYVVLGGAVALAASARLGAAPFGLANQVTLLRAGLVCLVGGALLASGQAPSLSWSLAALVAAALLLDAVDGWLARRLRLVSSFGARFDVEIDALLLLILALLVWQADRVGGWVLAIGLLRYAFVLAGGLWPWLRAPLAPSRRRKVVCAQQGVTLLLCLLPPVAPWLASAGAAVALICLVVSFAADVLALAQRQATPAAPLPEQA
jgi:phosphatidylglycerophosphate synthase